MACVRTLFQFGSGSTQCVGGGSVIDGGRSGSTSCSRTSSRTSTTSFGRSTLLLHKIKRRTIRNLHVGDALTLPSLVQNPYRHEQRRRCLSLNVTVLRAV